jgi:CENP-B N-terminal DNA-binding domain
LTLQKKLELFEDLESGMRKSAIYEKYKISRSGLDGIVKSKEKIIESHKKLSVLKIHNRKVTLNDNSKVLKTALLMR